MFIAALFIIHNSQKEETMQMSTNYINVSTKIYLHTMEYYVVRKRNEVLMLSFTWMNLENIMLNEESQTHKASNIHFVHEFIT